MLGFGLVFQTSGSVMSRNSQKLRLDEFSINPSTSNNPISSNNPEYVEAQIGYNICSNETHYELVPSKVIYD